MTISPTRAIPPVGLYALQKSNGIGIYCRNDILKSSQLNDENYQTVAVHYIADVVTFLSEYLTRIMLYVIFSVFIMSPLFLGVAGFYFVKHSKEELLSDLTKTIRILSKN